VLATIGPSYLSYVQWALAADPPPELRAMVSQNGVSDPYSFAWPGGTFALENVLVATAAMLSFERGMIALIRSGLRVQRRLRRVARQLPLIDAYPGALGGRVSHLDEWLRNPGQTDPYWSSLEIGADRPVPSVPASLLTGWWDVCLDEVLERYRQLRANGTPARLVIGPWTHASGFSQGLSVVLGEALSWLRAYTADGQAPTPAPNENLPVRVHVGGAGEWRDLADWPPPGLVRQPWYLAAGGSLSAEPTEPQDAAQPGVSSFRYDPADPTPSAGGQLLTSRAGAVDNRALEARPDVLVFTSAPLTGNLEVIGPVSVRVRVHASGPHFDLFARLCDVDPRGRSRNVCDGIIRCDAASDAAGPGTAVTVPMSATAYQFGAGHRLRLQVSGGAHPRFARNTGSGEPPATTTRLAAVDVQIVHEVGDPAALSLPVVAGRSDSGAGNGTLGHQHTSRSPDVNPRVAPRSRTDL
jgi:putative CocE/NonD family hydrolase